jgi:hypothetical protein
MKIMTSPDKISVGQLRKWNKPNGEYTHFVVIGERTMTISEGLKEKRFTVWYPNGQTQEYWESDLMPGFNETYDYTDDYSAEVTCGNED